LELLAGRLQFIASRSGLLGLYAIQTTQHATFTPVPLIKRTGPRLESNVISSSHLFSSSRRGRADPVLYSGKLQALRAVNDNEQESRAVARKPRDVA